jgi:hypothetical protein
MSSSSGACKTNEAASKAAWTAAAAALPGLAAPRKLRISETLAFFKHRWSEQQRLGVSAKEFANKSNLTEKSVTDQTFLTAGEDILGIPRAQWIGDGTLANFNATGLSNYKDCLQSGVKTVSNIYLALNCFAHPSARISLQGYLEQIYNGLPKAQNDGRNEVYVMRFRITKGREDEFLKDALSLPCAYCKSAPIGQSSVFEDGLPFSISVFPFKRSE